MSNQNNTNFLEAKVEDIQEAVGNLSFTTAERIAHEVKDAGFPLIARELFEQIEKAKQDSEDAQEATKVAGEAYDNLRSDAMGVTL